MSERFTEKCAIVYKNNGVLEIAREVHINVFPRIQQRALLEDDGKEENQKKKVGGGGGDKERETTRTFDNKFIGNCLNRIRLVLVFWLGLVSLCHLGCLV